MINEILKKLLNIFSIQSELNILRYIRRKDNFEYGNYYILNSATLQIYKYIGYGSIYVNGKNVSSKEKKYNIFLRTGFFFKSSILQKCKIDNINKIPVLTSKEVVNNFIFNNDNCVLANMIVSRDNAPISIYKKDITASFKLKMPVKYSKNILKENKFAWHLCDYKIFFELDD